MKLNSNNVSKSIFNKSLTKSILKIDKPIRQGCYNCVFFAAWNNGNGYPCNNCKRNSVNKNIPCMDFYKKI